MSLLERIEEIRGDSAIALNRCSMNNLDLCNALKTAVEALNAMADGHQLANNELWYQRHARSVRAAITVQLSGEKGGKDGK